MCLRHFQDYYIVHLLLTGRIAAAYFLEETLPKNIATSIKDEKFLNFFFSRVRLVNQEEALFLQGHGIEDDYPFVSLCGKEVNFIRPAATPIVFHSLVKGELHYGGDLKIPFDPTQLAISEMSGRLYHRFSLGKGKSPRLTNSEYGLIRSTVAVSLSDKIIASEELEGDLAYQTDSGTSFPIQLISMDAEDSTWSLPYHAEATQ